MKGLFITFEGMEGCGKSTQAKLLQDYLLKKKHEVLLTREPGGPRISEEIRALLLNPEYQEMIPVTEVLLYMASRSQHTGEWIIPALKEGKIVISDRYTDSTLAYQGAARKVDFGMIRRLNRFATFATEPDITFLIDVPVKTGLSRIESRVLDRLEQEDFAFHQKVRKKFLFIAKRNPKRFIVINGKLDIETIHEQICSAVMHKLKEV
ncbi:MAG TPA: dTMP kinase [Candidatus Cloacimonadota bacterium]|nr:dTMP kinase [Candidatus Cloacimonadota bacterium]HPT72844.1 dTMP kinase [Candidatus Cloacimonadota bacterium]